jgi:hypothetical protein
MIKRFLARVRRLFQLRKSERVAQVMVLKSSSLAFLFTAPVLATIMEDFGTTLMAWLDVILDLLIGSFEGVVPIFWDSTDGFTIYGLLMLFGLVIGFVGLALGFLRGLIQK